jgi:uncharacterized protein
VMEVFARLVTRKRAARVIVGAVAVLAAVSLQLSLQVEHDDDLLAFLPKGNAEVETFYGVNKRFGGLDLALVGLETDDVFAPEFIRGLDATTRSLEELSGLAHVVSLSNVEDFSPDAEGGSSRGDWWKGSQPAWRSAISSPGGSCLEIRWSETSSHRTVRRR